MIGRDLLTGYSPQSWRQAELHALVRVVPGRLGPEVLGGFSIVLYP